MTEPQLEQPVVKGGEPVFSEVERRQLFLPVVRILSLDSGARQCVVASGIFSAIVKEVEDEEAMRKREEDWTERLKLAHAQKQTSPGAAGRAKSVIFDERVDQPPIMRQEISDLRPEGLAAQNQAFYFSGGKSQHTEGEGDRLISQDLVSAGQWQKNVLDFNQGITLAFDSNGNVLYFKTPEEIDPFDLALSCITMAKIARDKKLIGPPSQLLKAAERFKDEGVFRQCIIKKRGLFGKKAVDPSLFKENTQAILDHAKRFVIGIESGAYI